MVFFKVNFRGATVKDSTSFSMFLKASQQSNLLLSSFGGYSLETLPYLTNSRTY